MNDIVTPFSGWIDAANSVQADTIALRRAIHAEPELGLQTPKTMAKVREARTHGAPARRHGRAADAGGHRPSFPLQGRWRDACLRARHAHRDARVRRAHECEAEVEIVRGFPVTVCDPGAVAFAQKLLTGLFGKDGWTTMEAPVMGAEDFSYVLQKVPGAMVFLGVCPAGQQWKFACPCHSNKMTLDESTMRSPAIR